MKRTKKRIKWNTELARNAIKEKWNELVKMPDEFVNIDNIQTFLCSIHGESQRSLWAVLHSKYPCQQCAPFGPKGWKILKEKLIFKHGYRYDYSLMDNDYKSRQKLRIICKEHGLFEQRLTEHLIKEHNCPKCALEERQVTTNDFLFEAIKFHGNTYSYIHVFEDYKFANDKIRIICKKHGEFVQCAGDHRRGSGCPECKRKSRGETAIKVFLVRHHILFDQQKYFPDFRSEKGYLYHYDFFIQNRNVLIEFDGIQHSKNTFYNSFHQNLERIKELDIKKNEYAKNNKITLIRIDNINSIEEKLDFLISN